jgi:hypothetical protein
VTRADKFMLAAAVALGLFACSLAGCATFRSDVTQASQQCAASQHLKDAGMKVAPYEAKAVACLAEGAESSIEACEGAVGASVVAVAPEEATDILRCAAALVSDAAKGKAIASQSPPDGGAKL